MDNIEFTTFIKALKFAAEKHRFERRKDELKSAYITHPIQVVEMLWNTGEVRDLELLLPLFCMMCLRIPPLKKRNQ